MDFEQFKEQVIEEMQDRFPSCEISVREVSKLQGESYTGMAVLPEGSSAAATINLNAIYESVGSKVSMEEVLPRIQQDIEGIIQQMPTFDTRTFMEYEQMKDKLVMQMIPIDGNEDRLSTIPNEIVEDMAVVYRFEVDSNEQGTSSILVSNDMLRSYGITENQLKADAVEAAVQNHPATLRNMTDVMREMMGDMGAIMIPDEPSPIWVASIEGGQNGAVAIQYPDFLDQAAETLGGDFYVLPSSIHEVLLVPDDGSMELANLENMVRSINETEVAPKDRLSDNVFHYDSEARVFENARSFEDREAGLEASAADKITVLLVEPGECPKVIETGTELRDLQELVGGYIEVTYPFDDNVGIISNEEGKLNGLPLNRAIRDENGEMQDIISGSFVVTGLTEESFGSLTGEQIEKFEEMFHQPEAFVKMGRSIMALPIPEETMEVREAAKAKAPVEIGAKPKHKVNDRDCH